MFCFVFLQPKYIFQGGKWISVTEGERTRDILIYIASRIQSYNPGRNLSVALGK